MNIFQRGNLITSAARAGERVLPSFDQIGANLDLTSTQPFSRFEAGVFQEPMVISGILARQLGRQRLRNRL